MITRALAPRLFVIPHCCDKTVNNAGVDLPLPRCQEAFCGAKNRAIESSSQYHSATIPGNNRVESNSPSTAADRPGQRHRTLLRDFWRRRRRADAADYGAWRPNDPLG